MRTTIDIDDDLISEARRFSNGTSKKAIVEQALREFIKANLREELIGMIGSEEFEIDMTPEELRRLRGCDRAYLSD